MIEGSPKSTREDRHQTRATFPRSPFVIAVSTNFLALIFLVLWVALDPTAERSLGHQFDAWNQRDAGTGAQVLPMLNKHLIVPLVVALISALSLLIVAIVLMFSAKKQSRLRRWLLFMTLCAAWLGLANGWRDLAWRGKQIRFVSCVPELQTLAMELHQRWPESDGNVEGLGPFMAYPVHQPETLLLLTPPRLATWDNSAIAAVERASTGGVRFQLASGDPPGRSAENDWLEWHPSPSVPASFTGGLSEQYAIVKASSLGNGWFLARYERPMPQPFPNESRNQIATVDVTSPDFE